MQKLRANTCGTEHTVATILANPLAAKLMQGMHTFVCPTRLVHGVAAKTHKGAMQLRIDGALGCWRKELRGIVALTRGGADGEDALVYYVLMF